MTIEIVASLWREFAKRFADHDLKNTLANEWASDPNVVHGRIQLNYPPTFQPGYIGPDYLVAHTRIIFLGYNPGEGKLASSQLDDEILAMMLSAFARGDKTFDDLNRFLSTHLLKWPVYREKGIFQETGDCRIALLPKAIRPSIRSVALLNFFPFKTTNNQKPLSGNSRGKGSLKDYMWESFVKPTIDALRPAVIIRYPDSDSYVPRLSYRGSNVPTVRVWHPSDYNLSAQRNHLHESWSKLGDALQGLAG